MGQLMLVRHGQASWGTDDYDVLSPLGWEQSRLLGEALARRGLKPDLVVHGDMRRHRETAEAALEGAGWADVELVVDAGWNEFDHIGMLARHPTPFGDDEPTRSQFQEWFEEATARWTGGEYDADYHESFSAFAERIGAALERTVGLLGPNETGLVFTSGGPVAWSAASLLSGSGSTPGGCAALWSQLNTVVVNSSITKVVVGGRGRTLVSFNEHSHLEGDGLTYR